MKIHGSKVLFSNLRVVKSVRGNDRFSHVADVKEQQWAIPSLKISGWVELEIAGRPESLVRIESNIAKEVEYALEQREKRKHGIAV